MGGIVKMNITNTADTGLYKMNDTYLKAVKDALNSPAIIRKPEAMPLPSIADKYTTKYMLKSVAYAVEEPKPGKAEKSSFSEKLKEVFKRIKHE